MRDVPFKLALCSVSPFQHPALKFNSHLYKCHLAGRIQSHRTSPSEMKGREYADSITGSRVVLHVTALIQLSEQTHWFCI